MLVSRACKFAIDLPLDDPELSLEVEGNATPYDPGVTSGPPESCYPPEGGEVEIENVYVTHCGTTKPIRLEISPLIHKLEVWDKLQKLAEEALANQPPDEPDYPDQEY